MLFESPSVGGSVGAAQTKIGLISPGLVTRNQSAPTLFYTSFVSQHSDLIVFSLSDCHGSLSDCQGPGNLGISSQGPRTVSSNIFFYNTFLLGHVLV